ncbi:MAG: hypothetical protein JWM36_2926 [Hyphomicrobiales bacterium]|nr:hypothetical protein [Hyphomicrobiales bacterium]
MKKSVLVALAFAVALPLAGCNSPGDRAVGGAAIGGLTGAAIGGLATGRAGGALVGGAIGAAGGAIIGANTAPAPRCARVAYDEYGDRVCVRYYRSGY